MCISLSITNQMYYRRSPSFSVVVEMKVFKNLLPLLLLKGCLLMNEYQAIHTARITLNSQELNLKNPVGKNLQRCRGKVTYINATSCSKHAIVEGGVMDARLMQIHFKLGPSYRKEYFMCDNTQYYDISMTTLAKLTRNLECIPLNLSRHLLLENNMALTIEYVSRKASKRCIIRACNTLLHNDNSNEQHQQHITQTYYTKCAIYESTEVTLAICGFFIVLSLFALFHDATIMRIAISITMIALSLALSEDSWMYLSFLLVFILLFIFTGASTSARFVKSFIFFMQTYYTIFPPLVKELSRLLTILRFNSLHFTTLPCIFQDSLIYSVKRRWNNLVCSFCAPLVALFIILCFILLRRILRLCIRKSRNDTPFVDQCAFAVVFVAYYSFFNSSTLAFNTFCNSPLNGEERTLAIFGLIAFGLLPFVVFTSLLYKYRSNLDDERVLSWLGYLYRSYRPENDFGRKRWQYYEIWFMCFRFTLSLILTLIEADWKFLLVIAVLLLMAFFYYKVTPFTDIWANFVALVPILSLIIICIIFLIPGHLTMEYNLILIVFEVTICFFVKIIVPSDWRKLCMDIKACCGCHNRSADSTEDSRRLLRNGATGEDEGNVRIRVIANIIEEYRGVEANEHDVQTQSPSHGHADNSEEENDGCSN